MGFLDIFKRRKADAPSPENELERCLVQAKSDMAARKELYQKLLWNHLFVMTEKISGPKDEVQSSEDLVNVRIVAIDPGLIPVFTSPNRIQDKGVIKHEVQYLGIRGQDIFARTKGMGIVINPYSDVGMELHPEEIEAIMDGTIYEKIDAHEAEMRKHEEFNSIFQQASARQDGLILLDGYHQKVLNQRDRLLLEESVTDFKKCLTIIPDHWQSMVLMAKSLQRLGRHAEALGQLEAAASIELENHFIPMEASLEAMHLNDLDKALYYSEESLKRRPDDIALLGNHAMNLLVASRDVEAKKTIEKAIALDPSDSVNRNIEAMVMDVISGRRKRPTFEDSIK